MPGIDPNGTRQKFVRRVGDKVLVYSLMVEEYDVAELEARIAELTTMVEPTIAVLKEFVKEYHPYYRRVKLLARAQAELDRINSIEAT